MVKKRTYSARYVKRLKKKISSDKQTAGSVISFLSRNNGPDGERLPLRAAPICGNTGVIGFEETPSIILTKEQLILEATRRLEEI